LNILTRGLGTAIVTLMVGALPAMAQTTIYDSIPGVLPTNLPSLGYQATSTSQAGDYVQFAGSDRVLTQVTVTMSNWALESTYQPVGTSVGYMVPLTFNIYGVDHSSATPAVGALIGSQTVNAQITWRPEATPGCGTGFAGVGGCFNGLAQNVTFDFSGTVVPDEVIWGLAFNTQSYGTSPTGVPGPYNSLNLALNDISGPSVGTDENPDGIFWNTSHQPFLTTGVAGTFGEDSGWTPYVPAVQFEAVPEPKGIAALFIPLLAGLIFLRQRGNNGGGMATT
jgi:hypothetical protein